MTNVTKKTDDEIKREEYLQRRRDYYKTNKEAYKAWNKKWFNQNKTSADAYRKKYKKENADYKKNQIEYREKNKDKQNAYYLKKRSEVGSEEFNRIQRERRKNRGVEQKERDRQYKLNYNKLNAEKIVAIRKAKRCDSTRDAKNKYHADRYRTDIQYKLLHNLRSRIKNAIKGNAKDSSTLKLLGCTLVEFQNHISSLFKEGMDWANILAGNIHIDHKKPCKDFDLTKPEEQRACFHWSNLQPLWAEDNLTKSDKNFEEWQEQQKNVKQ